MHETNSPLCFWDYCVERRARINNLTAKNAFKLHGSTPHTVTTGDEGDISNLCQYGWYEWCYFRDHTAASPNNKEVLGRVLGPARGAGNEMAQWILKANGRIGWIDVNQPGIPGSVMGMDRVRPHHLIGVDWAQNRSR